MSLEAAASVQEDMLIPGLSYSLSPGGVLRHRAAVHRARRPRDRTFTRIATGQRVLRFTLSDPGNGLLDLSTVRLSFASPTRTAPLPLQLTGQCPCASSTG